MRMGSLHFASDKAIFDALTQRSLTSAELRSVFLSRGIVISNDSDKKFLAKRFSALFHDYYDYQRLSLLVGGRDTRDKTTNVVVTSKVSHKQLDDSLNSVKEWLVASEHNEAEVTVAENKLTLTVKYQKLDFSQAEFRQVVDKTAVITVEKQGKGWKITGPMNEKFKDITEELYSQIEIQTEKSVSTRAISLAAIEDAAVRTSFLRQLIYNVKDMEVFDVVDVSTFNPSDQEDDDLDLSDPAMVVEDSIEIEEELDESDDDAFDGEDADEDEEEENLPPPQVKVHKIIRIDKASLKGKGVLESKQLLELEGHGFYLWKIRWKAREPVHGAELIEFEAQFGNQARCTDFSYIVKGVYNYHNGKYSKSSAKPDSVVDQKMRLKVEQAAQKTLDEIERSLV